MLTRLSLFRRSERGSMSLETVLMVPLLLFAYAGLFTFFDAFRTLNLNIRGSYTIADMLSRSTGEVDVDGGYIAGLNKVLGMLTQSDYPTVLRVSVVKYDGATGDNLLIWSAVDGGTGEHIVPLTQAALTGVEDSIPVMASGDWSILVETWSGFVPMMRWLGVEAQYFHNAVVTRARFVPQLCFDDGLGRICPY